MENENSKNIKINNQEEKEEELKLKEFLKSDITPTQALNLIVGGVEMALEGNFYEQEDQLILNKCLLVLNEYVKKGEDFTIKV